MDDKFKNFNCGACRYYAHGYCFEHLMNVKPFGLCPEWKAIWEE